MRLAALGLGDDYVLRAVTRHVTDGQLAVAVVRGAEDGGHRPCPPWRGRPPSNEGCSSCGSAPSAPRTSSVRLASAPVTPLPRTVPTGAASSSPAYPACRLAATPWSPRPPRPAHRRHRPPSRGHAEDGRHTTVSSAITFPDFPVSRHPPGTPAPWRLADCCQSARLLRDGLRRPFPVATKH